MNTISASKALITDSKMESNALHNNVINTRNRDRAHASLPEFVWHARAFGFEIVLVKIQDKLLCSEVMDVLILLTPRCHKKAECKRESTDPKLSKSTMVLALTSART